MDFPGCELWDFSCSFYQNPEVEACCLALQDRHQANVNLLLLCCWFGLSGRGRLSPAQLGELQAQVAVWQQQVVLPLRRVRQQLKRMSGYGDETIRQLRRQVLASELDAEHREQLMLERALEPFHQQQPSTLQRRLEDIERNLDHYLQLLGLDEAERHAQVERLGRLVASEALVADNPQAGGL